MLMANLVRRDWCEEHNRGSLAENDGLCVECLQQTIERLRGEIDGRAENDIATAKANAELIAECDALKALMKRREGFILGMIWSEADKREALEQELTQRTRERDGEREAREKIEVAYRKQDAAMSVLFERLSKAGVDCSDLIS
jgi:hypothetical protein